MFTSVDKMLVAVLVPGILWVLNNFGVAETMTVGEAVPMLVTAIATAIGVYFTPNK